MHEAKEEFVGTGGQNKNVKENRSALMQAAIGYIF
jgi:hypothetical protein